MQQRSASDTLKLLKLTWRTWNQLRFYFPKFSKLSIFQVDWIIIKTFSTAANSNFTWDISWRLSQRLDYFQTTLVVQQESCINTNITKRWPWHSRQIYTLTYQFKLVALTKQSLFTEQYIHLSKLWLQNTKLFLLEVLNNGANVYCQFGKWLSKKVSTFIQY